MNHLPLTTPTLLEASERITPLLFPHGLERAVSLASRFGAKLTVVH